VNARHHVAPGWHRCSQAFPTKSSGRRRPGPSLSAAGARRISRPRLLAATANFEVPTAAPRKKSGPPAVGVFHGTRHSPTNPRPAPCISSPAGKGCSLSGVQESCRAREEKDRHQPPGATRPIAPDGGSRRSTASNDRPRSRYPCGIHRRRRPHHIATMTPDLIDEETAALISSRR
jgi:hypothetical protein